MLELGEHSARLHAALGDFLAGTNIDMVLLAGAEIKATAENLPDKIFSIYRPTGDELRPVLLETVRPGDVIMIKSSNGIGFSKLVDALTTTFPARPVAAERA